LRDGNHAKAADQYRKAHFHMSMTGDVLADATQAAEVK
jgi:hypothetical protein